MIGEILDSVLKECQALLSSTGATVILKTNFLPKRTPDNNGNFILLALDAAPDTIMYPGGLTRCDWKWDFGSYNWEPDAYGDDQSGFSTDLLNFIDRIRQHFSLGALGKGVAMPGDTLKVGVVYQVINGTIVYDGNPLTAGTFFICVAEALTFTSTNNGYVVGTSWLTQAMVTIFNNYGFQFTLTGITAADALDQDGLIMGFKIGFDSTAFDQVTQFNEDDVILTTINPVLDDGVEVDESFETVLFPTLYIANTTQLSAILNKDYKVLRPNFSIDVIQNSFTNLNNTIPGASGKINVNLLTGGETIHFNGNETFTKPTIPGPFEVDYENINGTLNFS